MIPLSKSIVGQAEVDAIASVILGDAYFGMGKEVKKFEEELANYLNIDQNQVVCVSSGTAALQLALQSFINPGDEVLIQSLTFIGSFQAISATGAKSIPCEIKPDTLTIDLQDAQKKISAKTRAIIPVHYASYPDDLEAIYQFAKKNNLRVIEDAAHSFGCDYQSKKIGSFGDIVCFSFDPIKNITSGEGGAIITQDTNVLEKVRDARLLGVKNDSEKRYAGLRSWDFDVTDQGYRYHMSNLFAALGRTQLKRFPTEFAPKRIALAQEYRKKLAHLSEVQFLKTDLGAVVPHIQPIRVPAQSRDALKQHLESNGIQTGIHYRPNHLLTYYGGGKISLPITEKIYSELITLPLHPVLSTEDIDFICDSIKNFFVSKK